MVEERVEEDRKKGEMRKLIQKKDKMGDEA